MVVFFDGIWDLKHVTVDTAFHTQPRVEVYPRHPHQGQVRTFTVPFPNAVGEVYLEEDHPAVVDARNLEKVIEEGLGE